MSGIKLFSLFSGAGGMDVGFNLEGGYELLAANDIKEEPAKTYSHNFHHQIVKIGECRGAKITPPAYFLGDVSLLDFESIDVDTVDVMVGGPPCQDFSVVRGPQTERRGVVVTRGQLYSHFIRGIAHLQPKMFVFENVPGLKSANNGAAYKMIQGDFSRLNHRYKEIGEVVGNGAPSAAKNYVLLFSDILDPADIGVPQRRRRLIIIGLREDLVPSDMSENMELRKRIEGTMKGKDQHFRKYPLTSMEAFTGKTLLDLGDQYADVMKAYEGCAEEVGTPDAMEWKRSIWDKLTFRITDDYLKVSKTKDHDYSEMKQAMDEHERVLRELGYWGRNLDDVEFPDKSIKSRNESESVRDRMRMIPPDMNHDFVKGTRWNVEGRGMSLIYRRLHPLKPSYTVVAFGGGGTWGYHYRRDRAKLTNSERARLQSFPDSYEFLGTEQKVRAQIGEAVPSLLGRTIAQAVKETLKFIDG